MYWSIRSECNGLDGRRSQQQLHTCATKSLCWPPNTAWPTHIATMTHLGKCETRPRLRRGSGPGDGRRLCFLHNQRWPDVGGHLQAKGSYMGQAWHRGAPQGNDHP